MIWRRSRPSAMQLLATVAKNDNLTALVAWLRPDNAHADNAARRYRSPVGAVVCCSADNGLAGCLR